ncbi:MAG: OmpA family protein [Lewinellaceae bacterium]|nr:OmpA family protein [Lewinellaceae bacterium]
MHGGSTSAQSARLNVSDFVLSGDTRQIGDRCFRLTEAVDWASGSIWYKAPIRLDASFEMQLQLMLGCDDRTGADGMVFVFSPYAKVTGHAGEGMGFSGLYPSLGIEIDTWENEHLSDPPQDHVAILQHGYVDHLFNLEGPVIIRNVEDCQLHDFTIRWDEPGKTLSLQLDGEMVISYHGNLVKELFAGNPVVYWGVTAATGKFNNRQEICFEKLEFSSPAPLAVYTPAEARALLGGKLSTLAHVSYQSGSTRLLPESEQELYKLLQLLQANPAHKIIIQGHTDNQGSAQVNQQLSEKRAQAIANFLISHGIKPDRIQVQGLGEDFPEQSNETPAGRLRNRRIMVQLYKPRA